MNFFSLGFNSIEQIAQKGVRQHMAGIAQSMTRLSTGKRINSAKDDPAGLIGAELLKSENVELKAKIKTTKELGNKLATTESHLSQIGNLLNDIKGAIVEGANTGAISDSELDALQMQIDYALDAIQRITQTASYKGEKLLEGLWGELSGNPSLNENTGTAEIGGRIPSSGSLSNCVSCTLDVSRTIQTDSLATLAERLFSVESDENGGLANITALLQHVVKAVEDADPLEVPGGESMENAEAEKSSDPGSVEDLARQQAEAESETALSETETSAQENVLLPAVDAGTVQEEADPYEAFFEMERQRESDALDSEENEIIATEISAEEMEGERSDTIDSETGHPESTDVVPVSEEEMETEDETESEEKKEFDPASTFLFGKPGDYWFRELDEFDYLNYTESEETATTADIIASLSSAQVSLYGNFMPTSFSVASLEPTVSAAAEDILEQEDKNVLDEPDEEEKLEETETIESSEEETSETSGGRMSDLRSGESASLRNDPERADRIIDQAIRNVTMMRARIGAEQKYTVDVNVALFEDQLVANTSAYSELTDADFAEEMSNLMRHQILLQSSLKVLEISRQIPKMMFDMLDASFATQ